MSLTCSVVPTAQIAGVLQEADTLTSTLPYTVHQTSDWYLAYINSLNLRDNVHILQVRDARNGLVGILPLEIRYKRGTRFWSLRDFVPLSRGPQDFFYFLARQGMEAAAARALATWFLEHFQAWETINLDYIPEKSLGWEAFCEGLSTNGISVQVTRERCFFLIDTTQGWAEYDRDFLHSRLADLRNRRNRLVKQGCSIQVVSLKTGIGAYLDDLFAHYDARRAVLGQQSASASTEVKDFIRQIVAEREQRGGVILSLLQEETSGDILAYQLDWLHQGVRFHWHPTFNPQYAQYSPGKMLLYETIKQAFEDPEIVEFNFMRGESNYKTQFTDQSERFVSLQLTNPRSLRRRGTQIASQLTNLRDTIRRI